MHKFYQQRKDLTVQILQDTIDYLISNKVKISIQTIVDASKILSPGGISKSTILSNHDAYQIYLKYRTWQPKLRRGKSDIEKIWLVQPVKSYNRKKMLEKHTKADLIAHIIEIEIILIHLQKELLKLQLQSLK